MSTFGSCLEASVGTTHRGVPFLRKRLPHVVCHLFRRREPFSQAGVVCISLKDGWPLFKYREVGGETDRQADRPDSHSAFGFRTQNTNQASQPALRDRRCDAERSQATGGRGQIALESWVAASDFLPEPCAFWLVSYTFLTTVWLNGKLIFTHALRSGYWGSRDPKHKNKYLLLISIAENKSFWSLLHYYACLVWRVLLYYLSSSLFVCFFFQYMFVSLSCSVGWQDFFFCIKFRDKTTTLLHSGIIFPVD